MMVVQYELHIGTTVETSDGKKIGRVLRLIVHPDTSQLDGFLVGKGHFTSNRIVAISQVQSADPNGVVLKLAHDEVDHLPVFIQEQMLRSPGDLTYQGKWGAQASFAGTGNHWVMRSPGGDFSTINSNSLYSSAPIGTMEAQNVDDLPEDSVVLSKGTVVIGSNGKKIGHVDEILFDSDQRIVGFLVKAGHLFTHDVRIPMSLVAGVTDDHVRLNVTAESAADASKSDLGA
jgi:uncharacterized protein YrrD